MKRFVLLTGCLMILIFAGFAGTAPQAPVLSETPSPAPTATPEPAQPTDDADADTDAAETSAEAALSSIQRIQNNLLTDRESLWLVSMGRAIYLYPEPTTRSERVKLKNLNVHGLSELIVLEEVTSSDGKLFYHVRSTFSDDEGYILAKDAKQSVLSQSNVSGYALIGSANCSLLSEAAAESDVLALESEHLVRILGQYNDYYYVITEAGNYGFASPVQLTLIDQAELDARLALAAAPAVVETEGDPLTRATAANAAKMLRAGPDSAAVSYWDTAQAHAAQQGHLKKATMAMLSVTVGKGQEPVGRDGIQFQPCEEVPPIEDGDELQQGQEFSLHGSIYTNSPLTSVTATLENLGWGTSLTASVTFDPAANICAYSLSSSVEPLEEESLNLLFFTKTMRAGQYHFSLTATTVAQPEQTTLLSADCSIVRVQRFLLTQNQFGDNYLEALAFFGGDTDKFLFHYSFREGRHISIEETWRETYLTISSLGRVHVDALANFEEANHYLKNTYVRVSLVNQTTGGVTEGRVLLLDDLVERRATYVPRFQSNLEYISHHSFGTAIDINNAMAPNKNRLVNHDLIGNDVKNHLIYNGIQTDENGTQYYDFTYTGSYTGKYKRVPETIINYLLYELAFYRAGFQWGYYYETTCDAMHYMLTENDINRHMHTDIGLRKIYEYIEPEWTYVPVETPTPSGTPWPDDTPARGESQEDVPED